MINLSLNVYFIKGILIAGVDISQPSSTRDYLQLDKMYRELRVLGSKEKLVERAGTQFRTGPQKIQIRSKTNS